MLLILLRNLRKTKGEAVFRMMVKRIRVFFWFVYFVHEVGRKNKLTKLYFVRHGLTDNNKFRRFNGGGIESDLLDEGREQASKLGNYLKATSFHEIFVSPQRRAHQTLLGILECRESRFVPYKRTDLLKEIGFGEWEGQLISDKKSHNQLVNLTTYPEKYDPEEFGGENYGELLDRGFQFLAGLDYPVEKNYLIVGHGVMLTSLLSILKGKELYQVRDEGLLDNTSLTIFESKDGKTFNNIIWNFTKY